MFQLFVFHVFVKVKVRVSSVRVSFFNCTFYRKLAVGAPKMRVKKELSKEVLSHLEGSLIYFYRF